MRTNLRILSFILLTVLLLMSGCGKTGDSPRAQNTATNGLKSSDLRAIDGDAGWQVVDGKRIPAKAQQLHDQARAKGEAGDYVSALALLKQAADLAPDWAYPPYDMAFTYLLKGDGPNALSKYREVDRLEPGGFFTAKTALWTLERENQGLLPNGTYLAFLSLEWTEPAKRKHTVEMMTTNVPTFAPAWKERALVAQRADDRMAFLEKALSLAPDPETFGICMLNKAALLNKSGKSAEARRILEDLIDSNSSTVATKALAKDVLKTFKQ